MRITEPMDLKEFERQYRLAQHIEKREQEIIKPLDVSSNYISIKEYAGILNISRSSVYALCAGGALEGAIKAGGLWRIPVKNRSDST